MELSDLNTESVVQTLHTRARDYMRTEIWPSLAKSWRYYDGQLDIPPAYEVQRSVDGRKVAHGDKTIVREVWDKIQAVLPDLARVFLSADEVVSFFPKNQKQEAYYEQATDYINHLFKIENDGENKILDSFISWLIKFCVWKVFWVNKTEQVHRSYRVDQQMFMLLQARLQDPESDIISLEYVEVPQEVPGPDGMPMLEVVYDVELVRQYQEGSVCVELVPPEEFLIDPDAMTSETPLFVGQSTLRTVSEVVSMGVPFEIVQQYSTSGSFGENNEAEVARRGRSNNQAITSVGDISLNYVRVIEALVQLDMDGDGIAEVHRVLMLGESATLINLGPGND